MVRSRASVDTARDASPSFAAFYQANWPDLVAYCAGVLGDRAAGEEMAQEAFVRVYPRWHRLDDARPYAFRVATNLCHRHRGARARVEAFGLAAPEPGGVAGRDDAARVAVTTAVATLSTRYRQVLLLHYYADMSVEEMATVLRRPAGTVKRQLHEARAELAIALGDTNEGNGDGPA